MLDTLPIYPFESFASRDPTRCDPVLSKPAKPEAFGREDEVPARAISLSMKDVDDGRVGRFIVEAGVGDLLVRSSYNGGEGGEGRSVALSDAKASAKSLPSLSPLSTLSC